MSYVGSRVPGSTIRKRFAFTDSTGALAQLTGSPAVAVYSDADTVESTVGVTLTVDFDGVTGLNLLEIDTSDAFYTAGSDFDAVITSGTADGVSVVGYIPVSFSLATAAIGADGLDASAFTSAALSAIQNEVISALTNESIATAADVSAVLAALTTDTYLVPGQQTPPTNPTLVQAILYGFKLGVHEVQQTSSEFRLMNRAGTVVDQKAAASDDGTTFTRASLETGP